MPGTSREDYILAVYELEEKSGYATNKELAQLLGITAASVSEMIRKLADDRDIILENKNIILSESGKQKARGMLTKHRLWEMFLVRYLGYSWQDVQEDAKALEYATSEKLKNRLNDFLERPVHCPHGNEIFENHVEQDELKWLSEMEKGSVCYVHKVEDDKALLEYMEKKSISLYDELHIKERDEYDNSLLVESNGEEKHIAGKAAKKIMVSLDKFR